jgi:alkanesulfonate monooxygenase SsuD/methylene tetrahydromethanopterin reductase-like flavin-dependent oxidoreductase (luciferase family)
MIGGCGVKFGLFFPMQMVRPWSEGQELQLFQDSLDQAECGDRLGVDYCWAQEHHFLEEYCHSTAPEVFLAAVSQRTKRMRLGHGITLMPPPYNHPARVAERIASLDLVSGGRADWGTGESSSRIELEGFGVSVVEKRSMWAEAVKQAALMMSMTPYPGYDGEYFQMPCRNVVPKPVQKPHPPLWVACTNRDTMKLAARLGLGALTFAFMDHQEAKFWVEEYYEIFTKEAVPLGRGVNPNVAMLGGLMCDKDGSVAIERGMVGQEFFKFGLAHYYRFGRHVPGVTSLWEDFKHAEAEPMAGVAGIGSVEEVRDSFAKLEEAKVDQVILLHQAGGYRHQDIMESLELFGSEVLPDFKTREIAREAEKAEKLAPYIAAALERRDPEPELNEIPVVDAYPRVWEQKGEEKSHLGPKRAIEGPALWKLHVTGATNN